MDCLLLQNHEDTSEYNIVKTCPGARMFFGTACVWAACSPAGDHSSPLLLQHFPPGHTDIKAVRKREG